MYNIIETSKEIDFSKQTFRESTVAKSKLWKLENLPYYLEYNEDSHDTVTNSIRRNDFDIEMVQWFRRIENKELYDIVKYFVQSGEVWYIEFKEEGIDELSELLSLVRKKKVEKSLEILQYLEEEEIAIKYITIRNTTPQGYLDFNLYFSGFMHTPKFYNTVGLKNKEDEKPTFEVINEYALEILKQVFVILTKQEISFREVTLTPKDKVLHPLHHSYVVLQKLFEKGFEETKKELNLNDEEAEYIKNQLLKEAKEYENRFVYKN
jgi:hypothetical protein